MPRTTITVEACGQVAKLRGQHVLVLVMGDNGEVTCLFSPSNPAVLTGMVDEAHKKIGRASGS